MRAIWAWPPNNADATKSWTDGVIGRAVAARLDSIIWFAGSGSVLWHSTVLPRKTIVTSEYDPLEYACERASLHGINIYAWWCVGIVPTPAWRAIYTDHSWDLFYTTASSIHWSDFSNADMRAHCVDVVNELADYPIAGVAFDYIRYPSLDACGVNFHANPGHLSHDDVTTVVHEMGTAIHSHPGKLAAAYVYGGWGDAVLQEWWTDWMQDGVLDQYMPSCYKDNNEADLEDWHVHYLPDWQAAIQPTRMNPVFSLAEHDDVTGDEIGSKAPTDLAAVIAAIRAHGYADNSHIAFFDDRRLSSSLITYLASLFGEEPPPVGTNGNFGGINSELSIGALQSVRRNSTNSGWEPFTPGAGGGDGSVTEVGLALPGEFIVTGTPITSAGTLTGAWGGQDPHLVLIGPISGPENTPNFRALIAADLPSTAVSPGTYGSATQVPSFTVDAQGRLTYAANVAISAAAPAAHVIDGALHTVSGRTAGQVLIATGATTFGWSSGTIVFGGTSSALSLPNAAISIVGGGVSSSLSLPDAAISILGGGASCSLSLPNAAVSITGGGTLAMTAGQTYTFPSTGGTVALLNAANAFTADNTIAAGHYLTALSDGVGGGLRAGVSSDVLWARHASLADTWYTPDSVQIDGDLIVKGKSVYTNWTDPAAITSNQDNYYPGTGSAFRLTSDQDARQIRGWDGGVDGKWLYLMNVNSAGYGILLMHEHSSADAENRFICPDASSFNLLPGRGVTLVYDGTVSRWRFLSWV